MNWWNRLWHEHDWKPIRDISADGFFAAIAGLWTPACACVCGDKREGINEQFAERNGYWKDKREVKDGQV